MGSAPGLGHRVIGRLTAFAGGSRRDYGPGISPVNPPRAAAPAYNPKAPISTITLSPSAAQPFKYQWERRQDLMVNLETYNIYLQGGPAAQAVDARVQTVFAQGWKCTGENEKANQDLSARLEELDWELHARQAVRDGYLYRFGAHEIADANDGSKVLVTRCTRDFVPREDDKGQIECLEQHLLGQYALKPVELAPEKAIMIIPIPTSTGRGISLFVRARRQIDWHTMVNQASADSIWRHGYPKWEFSLASEDGSPVPANVTGGMEGVSSDLGPNSELMTNAASRIIELDKGGILQVESYGKWALTELCAAIGTPEELLGLGAGSTEATANVKLQAFYDICYADGCTVASQYQRQLVDRVILPDLGYEPGESKLQFNHPNPRKLLEVAQTLQAIASINPMDAEWLLTRDEQLGLLGFRRAAEQMAPADGVTQPKIEDLLQFQRRVGR